MPRIKQILFDVGNVLVNADFKLTEKRLEQLGVSDEKTNLFNKIPEYRQFSEGLISEENFCEALRTALSCATLGNRELHEAHDEHIYSLNFDVKNCIEKARCPVGFATDTNIWQEGRVETLLGFPLEDFGGPVFRSNQLGISKKESAFFSAVVSRLEFPAETILLVDDSTEKLASANYVGLQCLHFTDGTKLLSSLKALGLFEH